MKNKIRSTTILGVINKGESALGGDGQVSLGNTVMKHNAIRSEKLQTEKFSADLQVLLQMHLH
jgi:ATP-dependent HslUV protease, peptidase subunit HslV